MSVDVPGRDRSCCDDDSIEWRELLAVSISLRKKRRRVLTRPDVVSFTILPFRLILDILREFFELVVPLPNCDPTLRPSTTRRRRRSGVYCEGSEAIFSQRDYFGYFKLDRFRTVFCLFWSLSLYSGAIWKPVDAVNRYFPVRLRSLDAAFIPSSSAFTACIRCILDLCSGETGHLHRLDLSPTFFSGRKDQYEGLLEGYHHFPSLLRLDIPYDRFHQRPSALGSRDDSPRYAAFCHLLSLLSSHCRLVAIRGDRWKRSAPSEKSVKLVRSVVDSFRRRMRHRLPTALLDRIEVRVVRLDDRLEWIW